MAPTQLMNSGCVRTTISNRCNRTKNDLSRHRVCAPQAGPPELSAVLIARMSRPSDQGQRYLGELIPEGFVQWDTTATLLNSNSSYFNARVRWTPPRIGERNNSLCPLSYFSRSSPW